MAIAHDERAARLEAQFELLRDWMTRLERRIDGLGARQDANPPMQGERWAYLRGLTQRQHGALLMLVEGASNGDIARRFGVSENTAKVYVRSIASKLGVTTRAQIVARVIEDLHAIPEDTYRALSGGVPKAWGKTNEGGLSWFPERHDGP